MSIDKANIQEGEEVLVPSYKDFMKEVLDHSYENYECDNTSDKNDSIIVNIICTIDDVCDVICVYIICNDIFYHSIQN